MSWKICSPFLQTRTLIPLYLGPEGCRPFRAASPRVNPSRVSVRGCSLWRLAWTAFPADACSRASHQSKGSPLLAQQATAALQKRGLPPAGFTHTSPACCNQKGQRSLQESMQRFWQQRIPHVTFYWLQKHTHGSEKDSFQFEMSRSCCTTPPITPFIIILPFIIIICITYSSYTAAGFFSVLRQWKGSLTLSIMLGHQCAVMKRKTVQSRNWKKKFKIKTALEAGWSFLTAHMRNGS